MLHWLFFEGLIKRNSSVATNLKRPCCIMLLSAFCENLGSLPFVFRNLPKKTVPLQQQPLSQLVSARVDVCLPAIVAPKVSQSQRESCKDYRAAMLHGFCARSTRERL